MKIDAHQHFWNYSATEYGWINEQMEAIRRDFLPIDLRKEICQVGVDSVISVQARQTLQETRWLLDLAAQNDFIKGVVGWVPLTEPTVRDELDRLRENPLLRAVRHVVQDEPDGYLLRKDFKPGYQSCGKRDLPMTCSFTNVSCLKQHVSWINILSRFSSWITWPNRKLKRMLLILGGRGSGNWRGARTFIARSQAWSLRLISAPGPKNSYFPISRQPLRRSVQAD
jgi:Amidohydrolase